jgi:hypothetical protein
MAITYSSGERQGSVRWKSRKSNFENWYVYLNPEHMWKIVKYTHRILSLSTLTYVILIFKLNHWRSGPHLVKTGLSYLKTTKLRDDKFKYPGS